MSLLRHIKYQYSQFYHLLHGTLVFNNGGGSAIGKIRAEGSDDSFYVSKLAGGGLFHFTSNNSFQFNQNVKLQTTRQNKAQANAKQ